VALVNSTTNTFKKPRLRERIDRVWFSRLVQHPARKRSSSIFTTPEPARSDSPGTPPCSDTVGEATASQSVSSLLMYSRFMTSFSLSAYLCPQLHVYMQQSHHHLPNHAAFEFFFSILLVYLSFCLQEFNAKVRHVSKHGQYIEVPFAKPSSVFACLHLIFYELSFIVIQSLPSSTVALKSPTTAV